MPTIEQPAALLIETTDEEGQIHLFEKVDEYDIEDQRYALLVYQGQKVNGVLQKPEPHVHGEHCGHDHDHDDEEAEEIVLMRIGQDPDGTDVFESIDDDAEFEKVVSWLEEHSDMMDGVDIMDLPEGDE